MSTLYRVEASLYRGGGEHVGIQTIGHFRGEYLAKERAEHEIAILLRAGAIATYSEPHDEYKAVMPDGTAQYIRVREFPALAGE